MAQSSDRLPVPWCLQFRLNFFGGGVLRSAPPNLNLKAMRFGDPFEFATRFYVTTGVGLAQVGGWRGGRAAGRVGVTKSAGV